MNELTATLTFLGGAGTVTGAHFLFDTGGTRILIDCGLEQGTREAQEKNREPFPYDPSAIDALVVTHAHLDHIGRIPQLVRQGFRGTIYGTPPTKDLAALMFEDAIAIMRQEEEEHDIKPLYNSEDVARALSQWQTQDYHHTFEIDGGIHVEFFDAGHILGSAIAVFERGGRRVAITGDLGNSPAPILQDTEVPGGVHYMLMESVYGDRIHEDRDHRRQVLQAILKETYKNNRTLLIPAFSIQRTQVILYELNTMVESNALPVMPIFLDSPLAIRVTDVYRRYPDYFNERVRAQLSVDSDTFEFPGLSLSPSVADSRAIQEAPNPKVIIAGSGMSHGGRIREHEKRYLKDRNATVLFVGYQTPGSLGRRIQEGAKKVRIDDTWVTVRARTETLSGYSAHKDRDNLISFAADVAERGALERVFIAMGEPRSSLFLAQRLRDFLELPVHVPHAGESFTLMW